MQGGPERRASLGSHDEVVALLTAVLKCANGSLDIAQLADVVIARLPGLLGPAELSLDGLTDASGPVHADPAQGPEAVALAAEQELDDALQAAWLFRELSPDQRQILPVITDPEQIEAVLGCGRSTAYTRRQQLTERLVHLCGGEAPTAGVFFELVRLCQP